MENIKYCEIINELLEIAEKSENNRNECLNCMSMYATCNGDAGAVPCNICEIEKTQLEGLKRVKALKKELCEVSEKDAETIQKVVSKAS